MSNIISDIFIAIGLLFNLFGCIGLLRLPDLYNRLQASTKCVTLGTCCIMIALTIRFGFDDIGIKGLFAVPLLFFTATVAAHSLIRGSYFFGIKFWDKTVINDYKEDLEKQEINQDKKAEQ
jgi:multicomponent Na+:H+ antiporter subunit G